MAHNESHAPSAANAPAFTVVSEENAEDRKPAAKPSLKMNKVQIRSKGHILVDIHGKSLFDDDEANKERPKKNKCHIEFSAAAQCAKEDETKEDSKLQTSTCSQDEEKKESELEDDLTGREEPSNLNREIPSGDEANSGCPTVARRLPSQDEGSVSLPSQAENVARLPSTDADSVPSGTLRVLPPLPRAPLAVDLQPMLFQCFGLIANLTSLQQEQHEGNLSATRMTFKIQQCLMNAEMQNLVRKRQLASSSTHADTAALEHIANRLNHDEYFHKTVEEVNSSLSIAHCTGIPLDESVAASNGPCSKEIEAAMSTLAITDFGIISEEEEAIERAAMTNEEKAAALSDLFGKFCSIDIPLCKKAKRDLDRSSIDFLIRQVKVEIDMIPARDKQALLEAQLKCRPEEFSDARIEKFLRSEGMNSKLAAQRLVRYWEARRELFGPDKCFLRMTLSEALSDDVEAIEAGMFTILPHPDMSGRPLVFIEPPRNTRQGYTPESLTRAVWYVAEVLARENHDPDSSFVWIRWMKDAAIHNYDCYFVRRVPYNVRSCWPLKDMPIHNCCSSFFMTKIGKPIVLKMFDKEGRARTVNHDVPESEILNVLAPYGIPRASLPTVMGGSVNIDTWLPLFVAQRRAIEMEEI